MAIMSLQRRFQLGSLAMIAAALALCPAEATGSEESGGNRIVASPAWSPQGDVIAFVAEDEDDNCQLWRVNLDGSGLSQLTSSTGVSDHPAWSPDGQRIYFISESSGSQQIWRMNADGSAQEQLTSHSDGYVEFGLSPDGTQMIAGSRRGGDDEDLILMTLAGVEQKYVAAFPFDDVSPTWSPDSQQFAFVKDFNVWKRRLSDLGGLTKLTFAPENASDGVYCVAWSPDTLHLACIVGNKLHTVRSDGSELRLLLTDANEEGDPTWSPDGSRIAFVRYLDTDNNIWVINADGTGLTRVTNLEDFPEGEAAAPSKAAPTKVAALPKRAKQTIIHSAKATTVARKPEPSSPKRRPTLPVAAGAAAGLGAILYAGLKLLKARAVMGG